MRALAIALIVAALPAVAHAAEWDTIRPGESTQEAVRAQFGQPTKVTTTKLEGYDSLEWLYEAGQAPRGIERLSVSFGLLTPKGYRSDLVRMVKVAPQWGVFPKNTVILGWGMPQRVGKENERDVFFYEAGLLVFFDKEGRMAETMIFTPPQKPAEGGAPPPR